METEVKEFQSFVSMNDNLLSFDDLLHLDASSAKLFAFLDSIKRNYKINVKKLISLRNFSISLDPTILETIHRQRDTWFLQSGR